MRIWPAIKDPDEVKPYKINWARLLDGDTIVTSEWEVVEGSGLIIDSNSHTDTMSTVVLSGGSVRTYILRNRITTADGWTYDQSVKLRVKEK